MVISNDHLELKETDMSDFTQALLISGSIGGVVIATQYGRRHLEWHGIVRALAMVSGFGWLYLSKAPTGASELELYAVGIGVGLVFAAIATRFTGVERDVVTGRVMTVCGAGFVTTWVVAMVARLSFVWAADHDMTFRNHLGSFMLSHQIHEQAIAPFFVLWALTMVAGRIATTLVRAAHLPAPVVEQLVGRAVA